MKKENGFLLGTISKKHGYKGELNIKVGISSFSFLKKLDHVFIEIDNNLIPYFFNYIKFKNNNIALIKFEDINSEQEAINLIGKEIYLPIDLLPEDESHTSSHLGFLVIDESHGTLGKVIGIQENKTQSLYIIQFHEKEILVPIVDQIIKTIDKEKREIHIQTPSGLLDLF